MNTREYNEYKVIHKDGKVEDINSLTMIEALESLETPDTASDVLQISLMKEGVKTLIEDEPQEIIFTTSVEGSAGGSIATPAQGRIHAGDMIQLKAVPDRNYRFVSWSLNGKVISNSATVNFTMPELEEGFDTAVFTASFELAPVQWSTEVSPHEAAVAGCLAFPPSGISEANTEADLIAVVKGNFAFDHWERNGIEIAVSEIVHPVVSPLAEGETECIYKAVFRAAE